MHSVEKTEFVKGEMQKTDITKKING